MIELVVEALDKVAPGRYSATLVNQLVYIPYAGMNDLYQFILPEIAHLENDNLPTQTIKEEAFRRASMENLWKKHFYLPSFLGRNMLEIWKFGSKSTELENKFKRQYENYCKSPSEAKARKLASDISSEMSRKFSGAKKTGEYVVFQKHGNENYYLCLGKHKQDDNILEWVKHARKDFPFLVT